MNAHCKRWSQLSDLDALGERIPDADREFLRSHAAACPECRQEAAIWRSLHLPEVQRDPEEQDVERTLTLIAATGAQVVEARRPPRPWVIPSAVGVLACAAAIALWVRGSEERAERPRPALISLERAERPSGDATAPSCSEPASGVRICVPMGPTTRHLTGEPSTRHFQLVEGRVVLAVALSEPDTTFTVHTPRGRVTAARAVYSVELLPDGAAVTRVIEGVVMVQGTDTQQPREQRVSGGQALRFGDAEVRTLSDEERVRDRDLLLNAR